jgi:hypothetical protein
VDCWQVSGGTTGLKNSNRLSLESYVQISANGDCDLALLDADSSTGLNVSKLGRHAASAVRTSKKVDAQLWMLIAIRKQIGMFGSWSGSKRRTYRCEQKKDRREVQSTNRDKGMGDEDDRRHNDKRQTKLSFAFKTGTASSCLINGAPQTHRATSF